MRPGSISGHRPDRQMANTFPYLSEHERYTFPPVEDATPEGIVGAGGNLSPGMLLSAYTQGIFPWFSENDPLLWWAPDPRFVLFPEQFHLSRSMQKVLRKKQFTFSVDHRFSDVISACSKTARPGQPGTWITGQMAHAYGRLHQLGYAHSVEAYLDGALVGGLYGVSLGRIFFGESMFSWSPNASKAAFAVLVHALLREDFELIDCQVYTEHLASLGALDIPRARFMELLQRGLHNETLKGNWALFSLLDESEPARVARELSNGSRSPQ